VSRTSWATAFVFALFVTACGGTDTDGTELVASIPVGTDFEASIDELTENLEDQQQAQGGGSATLTVGDQTWTFAPVLCAFGEEIIGQPGAVFNLSSIQDGMQMYASVDSFGNSISLDDIENFESPSVNLSVFGDAVISIDGKNISGEGEFIDGTSGDFSATAGTFSATCP